MTDRELLELAAKAAGRTWLSYHHTKGLCCRDDSYGGLIEYYWNPLISDGNALRLAVKLNLDIELQQDCVYANGVNVQNYQLFEWHNDDPYAATRRAITRAAAEIGKALQSKSASSDALGLQ